MNHLNKFFAISAVYFGLASAVGAQSTQAPANAASAQTADRDAPQKEFQHPMLEQRSSSDMRPGDPDQRIQRRGMQETRRDGDIQRNVLPGAADAEAGTSMQRDQRDRQLSPSERRTPN